MGEVRVSGANDNGVGTGVRAGRATLPTATVQRMERLIGGDPVTEEEILRFIASRYGARSLVYLPAEVASEICRRPADFVRAARGYGQPELGI